MMGTGAKVGAGFLLALGLGAFLYYARGALPAALASAGNAINPTNPGNVFAQGANALTRAVTGSNVDTLGTALASSYSDRVGREMTAPYILGERHGSGLDMAEFLGNPFDAAPIFEGPGGAAFGLYPKP